MHNVKNYLEDTLKVLMWSINQEGINGKAKKTIELINAPNGLMYLRVAYEQGKVVMQSKQLNV